jgi:hypothetical protein
MKGYLDPSAIMEPGESDITKKYTLYMETQNYQQLTIIKLRRLQWAGHVQRMESHSIPRMVMAGQMF